MNIGAEGGLVNCGPPAITFLNAVRAGEAYALSPVN